VALFKELIGKHGLVVSVGKPAEHFEDTPVFVEFDDDHTRFNLRPNELAFE